MSYDIVIPTLGRPSLAVLLQALTQGHGPSADRIVIVDDRRAADGPLLAAGTRAQLGERIQVVRGRGAGPAAARNLGWRQTQAPWIVFLDDDVVPPADWAKLLEGDLADLPVEVGGSQGRIIVPLAAHRRPTDWERNVQGLQRAR